jgi:hypothetical protein
LRGKKKINKVKSGVRVSDLSGGVMVFSDGESDSSVFEGNR